MLRYNAYTGDRSKKNQVAETRVIPVSAGNDRPALMMDVKNVLVNQQISVAGQILQKGSDFMTSMEFRAAMLEQAIGAAKVLCLGTSPNDKKIEPEQVRKNVATILSILTETEDFLNEYLRNVRSNSED